MLCGIPCTTDKIRYHAQFSDGIHHSDCNDGAEPFCGCTGGDEGGGVNLRGAQRFFLINPVKIILFINDAGLLHQYPLFSMIVVTPDGIPRGGS